MPDDKKNDLDQATRNIGHEVAGIPENQLLREIIRELRVTNLLLRAVIPTLGRADTSLSAVGTIVRTSISELKAAIAALARGRH